MTSFIHLMILFLHISLFLNLVNNLRIIPKPIKLKRNKEKFPLISVLIPVRNEERNIKKFLKTNIFIGLFYPLTVFVWILIALNSLRLWVVEKGIEWKGRFYPIEK